VITALDGIRASEDPAVAFAALAGVTVPAFADGCQIELQDGMDPPFRVSRPEPAAYADACSSQADSRDRNEILVAPFRVAGQACYPPYAGTVTFWQSGRAWSEADAVIADLLVKHVTALIGRERLMTAVARAEEQAATLALHAISSRTLNLAVGCVMHQAALPADEAEKQLREQARASGRSLSEVAASVVQFSALRDIRRRV
jgi:ANTAR domain